MSHNKILALILGMVTILLMGCVENLDSTPVPTAPATVVPTNTPEPIPTEVPTITPIPTEEVILPAGCISWLVDADYNFAGFLCGENNPQVVEMTAGNCLILADEAQQTLAIHYMVADLDDPYEVEIAEPGIGAICVWFNDKFRIWAEPLQAYQDKECFGTLDLADGGVPLCTYPTGIGLMPGQCFTVNTQQPVTIFFPQPGLFDDSLESIIKKPGEMLCNGIPDILNTQVWAKPAE